MSLGDAHPYAAVDESAVNKPPRRVRGLELLLVMCLLLASGSVNFVLLKVLFTAYGEANAFFVSQGINLLYVAYGALVTYPRLLGAGVGDRVSACMGMGAITPAMRRSPQRRFMVMGLLDCFGTFFTAAPRKRFTYENGECWDYTDCYCTGCGVTLKSDTTQGVGFTGYGYWTTNGGWVGG